MPADFVKSVRCDNKHIVVQIPQYRSSPQCVWSYLGRVSIDSIRAIAICRSRSHLPDSSFLANAPSVRRYIAREALAIGSSLDYRISQ